MSSISVGKKIEALLRENGLRQSDLAKHLGITRSSVNGWIKGKHSPCSEKLKQVALFFQVDVKWLRDGKKKYPPDERFRTNKDVPSVEEEPASYKSTIKAEKEDQDVEIITENLFRINNPELQALLADMAVIREKKDSRNLLSLFGRLIKIIKDET